MDEAGRGPWAGPVVAAAVVLNPNSRFQGLNDSKQVSPKNRERLFGQIREEALFYAVAVIEPSVIDKINILQATFLAMEQALFQLGVNPDMVLVDGNRCLPHYQKPQQTVIEGDAKSASVAAASILAKVTRDHLMAEAHEKHPQYDFLHNKGYGTPSHQSALRTYGPCVIHRRTYAPVKNAVAKM